MMRRVLVTGGAGFIGSALIRYLVGEIGVATLNVDKLTYAASLASLDGVAHHPLYHFLKADIVDRAVIHAALHDFRPDIIIHLAAETHVDRSIDGPAEFINTNVFGTFVLLNEAYAYWRSLQPERQSRFRFHHVSTDEVFGSLPAPGRFDEMTRYDPSSPYAASKAAADHLVRAWHRTYGLPVILSNSSNNYGPYQFPEKFIPMMILKGLMREPLPVYGVGDNVRDWLYVDDHARALWTIATEGTIGETYLVGGDAQKRNIDVAHLICDIIDELAPDSEGPRAKLISFVPDRPGHDLRYAVDSSRLRRELRWTPQERFDSGLRQTVAWYLNRRDWWQPLVDHMCRGERRGRIA